MRINEQHGGRMTDNNRSEHTLRLRAKNLYWRGFKVAEIAAETQININTLHSWRRREKWDSYSPAARAADSTLLRYLSLIERDPITLTPKHLALINELGMLLATMTERTGSEK